MYDGLPKASNTGSALVNNTSNAVRPPEPDKSFFNVFAERFAMSMDAYEKGLAEQGGINNEILIRLNEVLPFGEASSRLPGDDLKDAIDDTRSFHEHLQRMLDRLDTLNSILYTRNSEMRGIKQHINKIF